MADTVSKRFQRSDLATFLPTPRLIKEFDALSADVTENIPGSIDEINLNVEIAQQIAETAQALASLSAALAQSALTAVAQISDGPPPAPQIIPEPDDSMLAQLFAMRDQLAVLTRRVSDLEEGPRP